MLKRGRGNLTWPWHPRPCRSSSGQDFGYGSECSARERVAKKTLVKKTNEGLATPVTKWHIVLELLNLAHYLTLLSTTLAISVPQPRLNLGPWQ